MSRGFTLIELIVVLAITGILLGFAAPSMTTIIKRNQAASAINWLLGNVNFTRHSAVTRNIMVTLCPSQNGQSCGGKWHDGTIVFTDLNADRVINQGDQILQRFHFEQPGKITWRAFQNKQYLQMTNVGFTNYQNGNFVYCPDNGDPRFARQLVINIQGRSRKSSDTDGDGIVEDRRGKDLKC